MSVTLGFTPGSKPQQRIQPFDPPFLIDWSANLPGDASSGTSTLTCTFDADQALIFEYVTGRDNGGTSTECMFQLVTGVTAGPAAVNQFIGTEVQSVGVATDVQFLWEPPRTMIIPSLGRSVSLIITLGNGGVGTATQMHGRAYAWPRNEVIDLPQRTFVAYLVH